MLDTKMREDILVTLNQLMDEKPMSKITMLDIANKCGVSRQTVYYYFSNLEEVVEASYEWQLKQLMAKIKKCGSAKEIMVELIVFARHKNKLVNNAIHDKHRVEYDEQSHQLVEFILNEIIDDAVSSQISKQEFEHMISFYSYAMLGVLREIGQSEESADTVAEQILHIMESGFSLKKTF